MEDIKMSSGASTKAKQTFSFTKEVNGTKKTVRGEEVENGWLVTIEKEWQEKNPLNESTEYKYGTWKYISKDNPVNKTDDLENTDERNDVQNMLADITKSQGMLLV